MKTVYPALQVQFLQATEKLSGLFAVISVILTGWMILAYFFKAFEMLSLVLLASVKTQL